MGIEFVRSKRGHVMSQRKYTLDLLKDIGKMGCRSVSNPIEANHKISLKDGEQLDE